MQGWILAGRLIERGLTSLAFIGVVVFLLFLYRKNVATQDAVFKFEGVEIAFVVTLPIVVGFMLLGFAYITFTNPIHLRTSSSDSSVETDYLLLDGNRSELLQIFTELSRREGGLPDPSIAPAQGALRLSLEIHAMRKNGKTSEVDEILADQNMSLDQIEEALKTIQR